jgi:hypothetical protein
MPVMSNMTDSNDGHPVTAHFPINNYPQNQQLIHYLLPVYSGMLVAFYFISTRQEAI